MSKTILRHLAAVILTLATLSVSGVAAAAGIKKELDMATVSLTSDDFQLAVAWSNLLTAQGSDLKITPVGTGTVKGLRFLALGKVDISLIGAPHYLDALKQDGGFKADPPSLVARYKDLRVLFAMDTGMAQYLVRADSPIHTLKDLKGRKISIGRPGGNAGRVTLALLRAHGLNMDNGDFQPEYQDFGPALEQLANGQIDAALVWGSFPQAGVHQASRSVPLRFLSPEADSLPAFQKEITNGEHYLFRTVPANRIKEVYGDYVTSDGDARFWTFPFMAMVHRDMPDSTAYTLCRILWDNVDSVRTKFPALSLLDIANAVQGISAPLHPGAERCLKERGAL